MIPTKQPSPLCLQSHKIEEKEREMLNDNPKSNHIDKNFIVYQIVLTNDYLHLHI